MIALNNLQIGYQGQPIMAPVNGCFSNGSMTAIVGENGTGKSTLLKTICGFLPAIAGTVTCDCDISWLPQQSEIDPSFPITVYDVVAMGCWPKRSFITRLASDSVDKIYIALQQTGIEHLAKRTVNQLSGGQFQRMLFARLLVQNAPAFLMDEPFTGIDAQTCQVLLQLMHQLHAQGKTIIAVLHSMQMVQEHFPRTLMLKNSQWHWDNTERLLSRQSVVTAPHPLQEVAL